MSWIADCRLLGLDPMAEYDPSAIKDRFRELALKLHPDVGGDRDAFEAVRDAYRRILEDAEKHWVLCPDCGGVGVIVQTMGFSQLRQACTTCGGAGKRR